MENYRINIEGMSCNHCVMAVRKELSKISDLTVSSVEIGKAEGTRDVSKVTDQQLSLAVQDAGYSVISIQ